jgi:hypothetical protein
VEWKKEERSRVQSEEVGEKEGGVWSGLCQRVRCGVEEWARVKSGEKRQYEV